MTKRKSNGKLKGKYAGQEFAFVNLDFNVTERQAAKDWIEARAATGIGCLEEMAQLDFKITCSSNSWTARYVVAATCKDDKKPIYNRTLVLEHQNLERAIQIMLYVVVEMFNYGETIYELGEGRYDW